MFAQGKRQGKGVMRYTSGEVASGEWNENVLTEDAPVAETAAPASGN